MESTIRPTLQVKVNLRFDGRKLYNGDKILAEVKSFTLDEAGELASLEFGCDSSVGELVNVARAAALILDATWEYITDHRYQSVIMGLADALRNVVEPADAYYFKSVGELNRRIPSRHLVDLLEKQLEKTRAAVAEEEAAIDRAIT